MAARKLSVLEMHRLSPEEYREAPKASLVVVLDNIRSMNNVGSIFRTADALGIASLYLCGITAQPPHADIHKTALGAEEVVPWHYFATSEECITSLLTQGYEIWCVEQCEGSVLLHEWQPINPHRPIALVVGNEIKGVAQQVIDQSHGCVEIQQFGTKHSMNVAVATGIVLWEVWKQITLKD